MKVFHYVAARCETISEKKTPSYGMKDQPKQRSTLEIKKKNIAASDYGFIT